MSTTAEDRAREIVSGLAKHGPVMIHGGEWWLIEPITAALREVERETIERCAKIAENPDQSGREWVPGSLWDTLARETAAAIRRGLPR